MSINTDVWGNDTEWDSALNGVAKITHYSLWDKVLSLDWTLNELLDNTVSYCGTVGDFYLNALIYFTRSGAVNMYPDIEVGNTLFFTSRVQYRLPNAYNMPNTDDMNRWSKYNAITDMNQWGCARITQLISKFKINKMLWIPYVSCQATNDIDEQTHEYRLDEYITTEHTTYPYVTRVYMYPYYNSGTDDSPQWSTAQENSDFYLWCEVNSYFSSDVDPNEEFSHYCLGGGDGTHRYQITIMGLGRPETQGIDDTPGFIYHPVGFDPDTTHYIYDDENSPTKVKYLRQYSENLVKEIYHQIAFYGVFFLGEGNGNFTNLQLTDPRVYVGIIEDGGYARGNYTHGADNANVPQYSWNDSGDSEYDPTAPLPQFDDNTYDGAMRSGLLGTFSTATDIYNIDTNDFTHLVSKLWDAMALVPSGDPLNDYCLDTFLTTNPIDSIVSLKYFPISEDMGINATTVKLGKYDTMISCKYAKNSLLVDCGDVLIYPRFGIGGKKTWLDKMTTITLYLPFCGTLSLDPEKYMGRYVNVEYAIDLLSGNCSAFVSIIADNGNKCITDIANGTCGIDCSVTGIQHITLDSQLYNATEQLKAMRINNAVSGLTNLLGLSSIKNNDLTGAVSQLATAGGNIYNMLHNEDIAKYNLQHTQLPVKMIGTTGATTGAMCELYPTIIIERPDDATVNKTAFAKTNGYACCISDTVGNFTGYTEFSSVDLSGLTATATEKNAIISALQGGVII